MKNKHLKHFLCLAIIPFAIASCDNKPTNTSNNTEAIADEVRPTQNKKRLAEQLDSVIIYGDTNLYSDLSNEYFITNSRESFFYYSLIMANKYEFHQAYLDVFLALTKSNSGTTLNELDEKTKNMALYYLLRAKEKGDDQAVSFVKEIFGSVIPSSDQYRNCR